MLKESLLDGMFKLLDHQLNRDLQDAVTSRTADGLSAEERKVLDDKFQKIWNTKKVFDYTNDKVSAGLDRLDAEIDAQDGNTLQAIHDNYQSFLDDPDVQQVLSISDKNYGEYLNYSRSIVDSSYDIAVELTSLSQLDNLDAAADNYLATVNHLTTEMKDAEAQLGVLEQRLAYAPGTQNCAEAAAH
jgi:hypothetical protein